MIEDIVKEEVTHDKIVLYDIVQVEDERTMGGESHYQNLMPLRDFRGNYGVPRLQGNKVVKGFFEADKDVLKRLDKLHEVYVAELKKFMPVADTETYIQDNCFHIEQPFIKGQTFESFLGTTDNADQIIKTYQHILDYALNFVHSSKEIVGIDQKPENWMLSKDKGWMFVDTFPPFYNSPQISFGDVFYLRDFEKDFADRPDYSFFRSLKKIARRFWLKSSKVIDIDLKEPTLEVLQKYDKEATEYWKRYEGDYK